MRLNRPKFAKKQRFAPHPCPLPAGAGRGNTEVISLTPLRAIAVRESIFELETIADVKMPFHKSITE
jgi:hypothetical protein